MTVNGWLRAALSGGCAFAVALHCAAANSAAKPRLGAPRKVRANVRTVVVRFAVIERPDLFYAYSRYVRAAPAEAPIPIAQPDLVSAPQAAPLQPRVSGLAARCARCHGGEAPKAGLMLDGRGAISAEARLAAIRRLLADDPRERMPPGEALSPAELGLLLQELAAPEAPAAGVVDAPRD